MNHNLRSRAALSAGGPASVDVYLSETEAAKRLGLSERTLQAWRCRGEGPTATRLGRSVRYAVGDLEQWLQSRKTRPTSA